MKVTSRFHFPHRTVASASSSSPLFSVVQAAPHRDCSRLAYHSLLQAYISTLKTILMLPSGDDLVEKRKRLRTSFHHAVDDCLLSSIFASRWVDVIVPSLDSLPERASFPSLYESLVEASSSASSAAVLQTDVMTSSFLASREGGSHIANALSDFKKAVGLDFQQPAAHHGDGSGAASRSDSSSQKRRIILVPFSVIHEVKWKAFATADPHEGSRSRAVATSVISSVGLMLRHQHELWSSKKTLPRNVLELVVIPPSTEFSLIMASAGTADDHQTRRDEFKGPLWTCERLASDCDVRTALLSKSLGCGGVIGLPGHKEEKNKFLSLGVSHVRWPAGADSLGAHRVAQEECSRLAHRFEQRETNIRRGVYR